MTIKRSCGCWSETNIRTSNIIKSSNDKRDVIFNNSYNESEFANKIFFKNDNNRKFILYNRNGCNK